MGEPLVCFDLVKDYGRTRALDGVSLEIRPGELVGLIGPNGAGKSTLVKIVCGLVRATAGDAQISGQPAGSLAAKASVGYLAELFRFPSWMTAREVVELHQRLSGSVGGDGECDRLLELVGLSHATTRRVGEMSKGMQQRLGLAQAMVGSPRLLLLDEPTSALDPAGRRDVRDLLAHLRDQGVAVLLNSHLLTEVEVTCDRVAILNEGVIVAEGRPDDLIARRGVEIETDEGLHRYDVTREDIPGLIAELVAQGRRIYEVHGARSTLEEVYLRTLEGGEKA